MVVQVVVVMIHIYMMVEQTKW